VVTKSTRNTGTPWTKGDVKRLRQLAKENTPTRVIGLKLGHGELDPLEGESRGRLAQAHEPVALRLCGQERRLAQEVAAPRGVVRARHRPAQPRR